MSATIIDLSAEREKRRLAQLGEVPTVDDDFDDAEVPVFERGYLWGIAADHYEKQRLLNLYFAEKGRQGDPGDET